MVKQVFESLGDKLAGLQLFEKVFPLAEIIDKVSGSFPAYYVGNGNYRPINLSEYAGVGYFRKEAPIQFNKSERESYVGSEILEEATLPVRLVISVKKELLNIDTKFASSYLTEEMFRTFSGNFPVIASKAGVNDLQIEIKNSEDDRLKIFAQEYTGSTLKEVPYDWIMLMLDMDVKLTFNKNCMQTFCDGYGYGDGPVVVECETEIHSPLRVKCSSFVKVVLAPDTLIYTVPAIENMEIGTIAIKGGGNLWRYSIVGDQFIIEDPELDPADFTSQDYLIINFK